MLAARNSSQGGKRGWIIETWHVEILFNLGSSGSFIVGLWQHLSTINGSLAFQAGTAKNVSLS